LLEDVAVFAIPQVELVSDDWPVHRVGAIDQLAVDDRVGPEILGQVGSAAGVPTVPVSLLRVHPAILAPTRYN
jgi:hypothetical protein